MKLDELRKEIDQIDLEMMKLFIKRMHISIEVGNYKKENNLPIYDASREQLILDQLKEKLNQDELWPYYESFMKHLMTLSKDIQA
jgi:monofunctional chorismate mutase